MSKVLSLRENHRAQDLSTKVVQNTARGDECIWGKLVLEKAMAKLAANYGLLMDTAEQRPQQNL